MKIQKRHIVLASLVLALGAAVYLNWQFSDAPGLVNTASDDTKELGQAKYVNSSVTVPQQETDAETDPGDEIEATLKKAEDDYFANALTQRQQTQDSVLESIKEVADKLEASDESKALAAENLEKLEGMILAQNNIEGILQAKGFSQCLCYISDGSCTVIVLKSELEDSSTLIVKDAVQSQYKIDFENITIVEI